MAPTHYAISEAVLLVCAVICIARLLPARQVMAAAGAGLLATAAAIGVVRFGLDQAQALAPLHKMVSSLGGLAAIGLISAQVLLALVAPPRKALGQVIALVAIAISVLAAIIAPMAGTVLGAAWLLALIGGVGVLSKGQSAARITAAMALASIMLVNALFVRRSALMSADISWHLYHLAAALWLVSITSLSLRFNRERPPQA